MSTVSAAIEKLPQVASASTPKVSANGKTVLLTVTYSVANPDISLDTIDRLDSATAAARSAGITVAYGGPVIDFVQQQTAPTNHADEIGLLAAVIILIFVFGTVVAAFLPLIVALTGVTIATLILTIIATGATVGTVAPILGSMIGLGVGIDYSLLIVSRFRQERDQGVAVHDAIGRSIATAGSASLFAGMCVAIALCGLWFAGVPYVSTLGFSAAMFVAVMVLAALTLLPALLGILGPRINKLRVLPKPKHVKAEGTGFWYRWGHEVARRAWWFVAASLAVLLLLAAPALSMRLGFTTDARRTGRHDPARGLRPRDPGVRRRPERPAAADGRAAERDEGEPSRRHRGRGEAPRRGQGDEGRRFGHASAPELGRQRRRRAGDSRPPRPTRRPPRHSSAPSATTSSPRRRRAHRSRARSTSVASPRSSSTSTDRIQRPAAAVHRRGGARLSFLLLMMVFRSILVPLKAAIMNLLSIGAAYGVIVAVFQWGWGARASSGSARRSPIVAFVPMMMFAILFGLSMDYEVFLLSRIREEYSTTRRQPASGRQRARRDGAGHHLGRPDHDQRVPRRSCPAPSPTVKMFGLGLAVAVFVDATIVRLVLVPATMELLGDANWWLPGWLDQLLPHINVEGTPTPAPVLEAPAPPAPRTRARPHLTRTPPPNVLASLTPLYGGLNDAKAGSGVGQRARSWSSVGSAQQNHGSSRRGDSATVVSPSGSSPTSTRSAS